MFSCEKPQYQPTWPNGPVGASNFFPVHFPSLPGSDYLSSSEHNGGLFIPPTYGSYSPSSYTSCHLMWQSTPGGHAYPMGQFFEPGQTCFIPYESQYMFIPPGYSSGPAPFTMQHHWNNGSGEQNFTFSCPPDESTTDYRADATEYCLSNNNAEPYLFPETCEAGLAPPHCQEMPACSVEQLDYTAENMHFDNIQPCHLMWQSTLEGHAYPTGQFDMVQFFEPGQTSLIPHESHSMFIPPGYSSGPAPFNMQHHWNNFSGEQNFPSISSPEESTADYLTDESEHCLSNNNIEPYLLTETCEAGLAPRHCQEMPACNVEQLDVTAENMHFDNIQNQPAWPNEPVGASHVSPLHFPSLPGSDCFSSSGHDGGLFIPPAYDSNSASSHTSYHLMWPSTWEGPPSPMGQFDMMHFFEPGQACFIPHESHNMFIPPGYNSSPAPFNMQHHWNNFSGEQNLTSSSPPEESTTDYLTDASEHCLSNNNVEPETREAELAPPHCQEIPACSVEQLDVTAENMNLDNIKTEDPDPRNIQEERPSKPLSEKKICQHDGVIIWEIEMPQPIAEQFIGKEGQYSKFVMQRCGGLVYMSQHPRIQHYMLCNIMGTKQQVQKALDLIRKRVKSLSLKNVYSAPAVTFGDHLNETPSKDQNGIRVFQTKPESS